jgi:hypothetical protein
MKKPAAKVKEMNRNRNQMKEKSANNHRMLCNNNVKHLQYRVMSSRGNKHSSHRTKLLRIKVKIGNNQLHWINLKTVILMLHQRLKQHM